VYFKSHFSEKKAEMPRSDELTVGAEGVPDFVLADSGEPQGGIRLHLARRDQDCVVTAKYINKMLG
jgi:hypothetical protein